MSDQLRNLNDTLEQSSRELNSLNSVLGLATSTKQALNQAAKDDIETQKESKEKLEKFSKHVIDATGGILRFGKDVQSSAGSFAPLGDIILKAGDLVGGTLKTLLKSVPILGSVVDAASKATAGVMAHMVNEYEKAYTTFEKISGSGVVEGFTMFEQSAGAMGLLFSDFDRVMTKGSKDLALLGGGAVQGTKMMSLVGAGSENLRMQFQKLGINSAEVSEFQLSYLTQQQQLNRGKLVIDRSLIDASGEYVKELDMVSKLTGQTRKEADQQRRDVMNDSLLRANIEMFPKDQQAQIRSRISTSMGMIETATKDKEKAQKYMRALVSGIPTDAPELASMMGSEFYKLHLDIKSGKADELEIVQRLGKALGTFADQEEIRARSAQGINNPLFSNYAAYKDLFIYSSKLSREDIEKFKKNQAEQTTETGTVNASMAESKQNLYKSSQKLEKLSVSSDMVAATMKHMSKAMYYLISKANKAAGVESPAHVQAFERFAEVQEQRVDAEQAQNTVQAEIKKLKNGTGLSQKMQERALRRAENLEKDLKDNKQKIEALKKQEEEKEKEFIKAQIDAGIRSALEDKDENGKPRPVGAPGGAPSGQPTQPTNTGTQSSQTTGNDLSGDYSGLNIRQNPKVNGVPEPISGGQASKKAIELARKIQGAIPGAMFTAFNDSYNRGPGSSHSHGNAVDFVLPNRPSKQQGAEIVAKLKSLGASFALDEYNNPSSRATGPHMHAQVSAATGGIMSGPKSGYLAELHGEEAVIQPQSASKQSLNSTVSGLTGPSNRTNLSDIYENLSDKMDRLVDILSEQHDSQIKFMESQES